MFCFFKNYLSPKSSPGDVKCIFESAAENFRAKSYLTFYQRPKKSIPLSFFPKKCLLRSSAGYAVSKPDNTSISCQKSTFSSKPTVFFIKKPNYGRKQHYSLKNDLNTCNGVLTKMPKVFAKNLNFFGRKSENFWFKMQKYSWD